jgi:hypothetical protein
MEPSDFELLKSVNLYEILGFVTKDEFTPELAKKSYKKLALKYHPDKNPNAPTDKFEVIQLAYLILSTPDYKSQYDHVYDTNSQTKDFKDLIATYKSEIESIQFEKISEEEFAKRIHELNVSSGAELKLDEILDQDAASNAVNKMMLDRTTQQSELVASYKADLDVLGSISDQNELNKKFNEMFDARNDEATHFDDMAAYGQTGLTVFNGCDALTGYTTLSNMNYNSMYASNSTYEQSFKLNRVPKYVDDNKSLEDRMKEYMNRTDELASIAKKSTSANLNPADYRA